VRMVKLKKIFSDIVIKAFQFWTGLYDFKNISVITYLDNA
jgi:hypothetical protein